MSSQARITEKLAGTDVKLQDQEYATLGKQMEGEDSLEAVLRARKAQRAAAEGTPLPEQPVAESATAEPAEPAERPRDLTGVTADLTR